MKVICPYAGSQLDGPLMETLAALLASGYPYATADVSGPDTAYTELMSRLWRQGETFAVIEQDIVPWRGALAALEGCPEPWCSFQYPFRDGMHAGLGCARFAAPVLAAVPDAVERTLAESTEAHPAGHWCQLDDRLSRVLTRRGFAKHVHFPAVGHLRPWPSHGCS